MKKLFLSLLFTFTFTFFSIGQPSIQWQASFGGSGNDAGYSIEQTNNGGFIVAGTYYGTHGYDYWIMKLNSAGLNWFQHQLGGTGMDVALSIQQTSDGGYVVAGYSGSYNLDVTGFHGYLDYWIVKLDTSFSIQWEECLGGTSLENAYSIQQTTDGGYIVAGFSWSNDIDVSGNHGQEDAWIVKLNSAGTIQWQKSLGGSNSDFAYSIQQTTDSGYIVAGSSKSDDGDVTGNHGGSDYWIVKLNSTGAIQWQKSLGGSANEEALSIQQTADGGYVVAGFTSSNDGDVSGNHGGLDYWIVKLNISGVIQWQKSLGGTGDEQAYSIEQTTDSGYIVAGYSTLTSGDVTANHGGKDYWIVKLNSIGIIQWQKCFGGSSDDQAQSIQQTTDGGFILVGTASSTDGDVLNNGGNPDIWIVKLNPSIGIEEINPPLSNLLITPNPLSQSTTISFSLSQSENLSVSVYDITGRLVATLFNGNLNTGNHELKWNAASTKIDGGVYFLRLVGDGFSRAEKLVVVE